MKKNLIRFAFGPWLFMLATTLYAQTYTDAVKKQRLCESHGELGIEVYKTGKIAGKTIKQHASEVRAGKLKQAQLNDLVMISIVAKQPEIKSPKDAYMAAWAECMDQNN